MRKATFQITIFFLLFSSMLFADGGDKKVRLLGEVKEGTAHQVTIKEIEKLGMLSEKIYNPYEKRSDVYGGVDFRRFVEKYAKKNVKEVTLSAIDDYEITITKAEWTSMRIILSTKLNGDYMSLRKKGPLRTVFPDYDANKKEYQANLSHWIWMIKKIRFK